MTQLSSGRFRLSILFNLPRSSILHEVYRVNSKVARHFLSLDLDEHEEIRECIIERTYSRRFRHQEWRKRKTRRRQKRNRKKKKIETLRNEKKKVSRVTNHVHAIFNPSVFTKLPFRSSTRTTYAYDRVKPSWHYSYIGFQSTLLQGTLSLFLFFLISYIV